MFQGWQYLARVIAKRCFNIKALIEAGKQIYKMINTLYWDFETIDKHYPNGKAKLYNNE